LSEKTEPMTLKIDRSVLPGLTVFTLSGRIDAEHAAELERLFGPQTDYDNIVLDLKEIRLADRAAVRFLARCQACGVKLENTPAYIHEWMERERGE
jgi:anti-anti-sigma regulatory factor